MAQRQRFLPVAGGGATRRQVRRMSLRRRSFMNYKIISALLILALASLACGFSFNLPATVQPGPDVTEPISVDAPASGPARLGIQFGAGELVLAPGAGDKLVDGTATYNFATLKPEVVNNDAGVMVKQVYKFENVPT